MANDGIRLNVIDDSSPIRLAVNGIGEIASLSSDNANPYYVGARAYVTQTADGATITVIDKEGTTTATVLNGADGLVGRDGVGIESITQNEDGALSINLDDGTSYVTEPLKGDTGDRGATGATGNGIASAVLNSDYTLTLTFTDGTSYTTPSIRGEKGDQGDAGQVDSAMSGTSALPVQNKVIKAYVDSGLSVKADASSVPTKVSDLTNDSGFIDSSALPTKVSDLTNDSGYITGYTETDPTVPSWAKAASKPSYTATEVGAVPRSRTVNGKALSGNITLDASDVGALPDSTVIPSALSDLTNDMTVSDFTNDAGYLTAHQDISGKADKSDTDIHTDVITLATTMGWVAP